MRLSNTLTIPSAKPAITVDDGPFSDEIVVTGVSDFVAIS
jgi:hypothetical protein